MRVFAVSGFSGTGKTTLVETLVRELVNRGHTVATIKSSKHDPVPERGLDTWRHEQAGASETLFLRTDRKDASLNQRISSDELARLSKHDFLLIEGMKSVNVPRIWCIGDSDLNLDDVPTNSHAIMTWSERPDLISEIPLLTADNVEKLVEIVLNKAVDFSEIE